MKCVFGHTDSSNIFRNLMEVVDSMPVHKLAGFTSEGDLLFIYEKQGVLVKQRCTVNRKLFATHCPRHRPVLPCKEGIKQLPDDIENTVSDTPFFFKDSSVRRDEFNQLKQLVEPDSSNIVLVQYHQVKWLSLSDCVSRIVQLLLSLVQYFEEQAEDTRNRLAV